jgi:hypothetical protein
MTHDLIIGLTGNLLAVVLAIALWTGRWERPTWVTSVPVLLGVLVLNVTGWLVVFA